MSALAVQLASCRSVGARARADPIVRALRAMERRDLWPGFQPERVPVAWFDGTRTVLLDHPAPPRGFVAGADGVAVFSGRHDAIRANTSTDLGGVPTAVAVLDGREADARTDAALLIHERFHVYQRRWHAGWSADELALLAYPVESEPVLAELILEQDALTRAVAAPDTAAKACWAARP